MQGFLRLFPLNWVIFPGEIINLHIFEPRYKQLIGECVETGEPFGVPLFLEHVRYFGSMVQLVEIRKKYPDGKLDITAKGVEPFEILNFAPQVENKLYPGGKVKTRPVSYGFNEKEAQCLILLLQTFFELVGIRPKEFETAAPDMISFTIGHKIGLTLGQEFDLLMIEDERDRQAFLTEHLENTIPTLQQATVAKKRIQMNGHFKNFDPLHF